MVWLSVKNISSVPPSKKLDHKRLAKFTVIQVISLYAYKLKLPKSMKIHPFVHVLFLESMANDTITGSVMVSPPPVVIGGRKE